MSDKSPSAQKQAVEKLAKENLKSEIKDHKEKPEKLEKNEFKEHKDHKIEKLEKNETKEHKDSKVEKHEKNEFKEHKDTKHEKIEIKDHKELIKIEHPEKIVFEGPPDPTGGIQPGPLQGGPAHFIGQDQRPDLSQGALKDEPGQG